MIWAGKSGRIFQYRIKLVKSKNFENYEISQAELEYLLGKVIYCFHFSIQNSNNQDITFDTECFIQNLLYIIWNLICRYRLHSFL